MFLPFKSNYATLVVVHSNHDMNTEIIEQTRYFNTFTIPVASFLSQFFKGTDHTTYEMIAS